MNDSHYSSFWIACRSDALVKTANLLFDPATNRAGRDHHTISVSMRDVPEPMMEPAIRLRVLAACAINVPKSNVMYPPAEFLFDGLTLKSVLCE